MYLYTEYRKVYIRYLGLKFGDMSRAGAYGLSKSRTSRCATRETRRTVGHWQGTVWTIVCSWPIGHPCYVSAWFTGIWWAEQL